LRALRRSYTGDKRAALDSVISDAEHGVSKDPGSFIRLREKYSTFLKFGFSQSMLLPGSNEGVCYSFSIDWARRILNQKATFAASKKSAMTVRTATPNADQKVRMMKKVDSRIRGLQAGFTRPEYAGNAPFRVFSMLSHEERFSEKYGHLLVFDSGERHGIAPDARGSGVLAQITEVAAGDFRTTRVFLVNFKNKHVNGGHAIGIHLPDDRFHFFDPNIGEFEFLSSADEDRHAFLDDWWKLLYLTSPSGDDQSESFKAKQCFESWKIQGVAGH
jgi:hypothetical protein